MISSIFETKQFRVQITGKTVWVESREGAGWIFRNQHSLPIAPDALHGRSDASVLRSAVQHFERTRDGDKSLREALTGGRERSVLPLVTPARTALLPLKRPKKLLRQRNAPNALSFRPLRPPLAVAKPSGVIDAKIFE